MLQCHRKTALFHLTVAAKVSVSWPIGNGLIINGKTDCVGRLRGSSNATVSTVAAFRLFAVFRRSATSREPGTHTPRRWASAFRARLAYPPPVYAHECRPRRVDTNRPVLREARRGRFGPFLPSRAPPPSGRRGQNRSRIGRHPLRSVRAILPRPEGDCPRRLRAVDSVSGSREHCPAGSLFLRLGGK